MATKTANEDKGFPNAEQLRAIADAAIELADVIAKSVVTDDVMCSVRDADANDLLVCEVLDKLESLFYVDPPSLAVAAEKLANRNVRWLTQEWPAGWLGHYAVKREARRLWRTIAGLFVYFGYDPLYLGIWDRIDGMFVRRVMQYVEHPPIRSEVIGGDGRIRRTDEGLSTSWLGRLRQHATGLLAALPAKASETGVQGGKADDEARSTPAPKAEPRFSWKVDSDSFVIRFDSETGKFLKRWVGFRRYRQLLQSPNGRVSMVELYGSNWDQRVTNDLERSNDLSVDANGLKVIDQQREELVAKQDEARKSGDLDTVAECEENIEQIDDWLKKNIRLKKQPDGTRRRVAKNISDPFASMRSTIWDSFTEARQRMIDGGMPNLAQHLEPGIVGSEGGEFTYSQSAAVPWVFE